MSQPSDLSQLSRDELEARIEELEAEVAELRELGEYIEIDDSGGDVAIEDILIGDNPIGTLIKRALERSRDAHERLDNLEDGEDGFSERARESMLPAHRMAVDIRNGHDERIGANKRKRAAELFRRMMHKVDEDGDAMPGVDNSSGMVTVTSSNAQAIIREFDDELDSVSSMQVTRAFRELQRLTKFEDCGCDSIDNCGHGLVLFDPGATNTIAANTARLIDYLTDLDTIQAGANADVSSGSETSSEATAADDAGNSVEATADDRLDQLADAGRHRGNGTANDVVSSNERTTLADGDGHRAGDTHE